MSIPYKVTVIQKAQDNLPLSSNAQHLQLDAHVKMYMTTFP